jgi:hypothetical protein
MTMNKKLYIITDDDEMGEDAVVGLVEAETWEEAEYAVSERFDLFNEDGTVDKEAYDMYWENNTMKEWSYGIMTVSEDYQKDMPYEDRCAECGAKTYGVTQADCKNCGRYLNKNVQEKLTGKCRKCNVPVKWNLVGEYEDAGDRPADMFICNTCLAP